MYHPLLPSPEHVQFLLFQVVHIIVDHAYYVFMGVISAVVGIREAPDVQSPRMDITQVRLCYGLGLLKVTIRAQA